jgi:rhodanese-related sulfurtransferase
MSTRLIPLKPAEVAERIAQKRAVLIDIREPDEFRRRHVPGALSRPLSNFETARLMLQPSQEVVFTCKSGMRTAAACERLAAAVDGPALVLEGGVNAWAAAGLPIAEDKQQPIEIMRQVQIAAGGLVLAGVALGVLVHPAFFGLSAFVGAGLAFAGVTGFCGMAKLLALAPWNRAANRAASRA